MKGKINIEKGVKIKRRFKQDEKLKMERKRSRRKRGGEKGNFNKI